MLAAMRCRTAILSLAMLGSLAPALSAAEDAAIDVGREIGALLAWRLGPEVVVEKCAEVEPGGTKARAAALKTWQERNTALIETVDTRIAEVVPLAYPAPPGADPVVIVRAQVKKLLLETVSADGDARQLVEACKRDADPRSRRWADAGKSQVHNSLAALYDWKVQREQKRSE
jgi:hypothetical protein